MLKVKRLQLGAQLNHWIKWKFDQFCWFHHFHAACALQVPNSAFTESQNSIDPI